MGLGLIGRSRDYALLGRPEVLAVLSLPSSFRWTHAESGATRDLYDCPSIHLLPGQPGVRLLIATHPATDDPPKVGQQRNGLVYELFISTVLAPAVTATDLLDLYLHRGSFETVLADEDIEQDPDRWCSHTPCGQEFWQILSQWVWNLRLELGQRFSPAAMQTTEFAPACEPEPAPPAPVSEPVAASEPTPVLVYGPPHWAQRSFTGGFPGSAFPLQPDGNLLCPANHPLYPQERRPERDGSYRLLYAARIGDCRSCQLRASCLESMDTKKPRRVSEVFWPISSNQVLSSTAVLAPPPSTACCPVLWRDWPRCHIRRTWLKVVRSEKVVMTMAAPP